MRFSNNEEENEKFEEAFDKILFTVHKVLISYMAYDENIKVIDVRGAKFKRCIEASAEYIKEPGIDDELQLWIRLIPCGGIRYVTDISSIDLPKKVKRKGLMTKLYESLSKLGEVKCVRITSVCTDEMRQWCKKMKLHNDGYDNWS